MADNATYPKSYRPLVSEESFSKTSHTEVFAKQRIHTAFIGTILKTLTIRHWHTIKGRGGGKRRFLL